MAAGFSKLVSPAFGLLYPLRFTSTLAQFAIRAGKKSAAIGAVSWAFSRLLAEMPEPDPVRLAEHLEENMLVRVGFFKRRLGSRSYRIPYMMDPDRSYRHSLKRVHKVAAGLVRGKKGGRKGMKYREALLAQLRDLYHGVGLVVEEKSRIYKEAQAGRTLVFLLSSFKISNPEALKLDLTPRFVLPDKAGQAR